jgi:hypothetical protein
MCAEPVRPAQPPDSPVDEPDPIAGACRAHLPETARAVARHGAAAALRRARRPCGALDADGFLTLKDRSKDLIISGGSNIYPREVEEVLLEHPGVREVSVVGQPDAEWGEVVVAFVAADAGVDAAALDALCLQRIARFKRPKHYHFLPSLPKNNYGKVLKTALRARLDDGAARC